MSKLWEHYGAKDPYYGVLSIPEFHSERMDEAAKARFFESGVRDVDTYITLAEREFGPLTFDTALDYGCGVGRLSRRLTERFGQVISVDISEGMIATARENLKGRNVRFENAAAMANTSANFILSQMVFQHIQPAEGLRIIPVLISRLHGTAIIELPIRDKASAAWRLLRRSRSALKRMIPFGAPIIPMYTYTRDDVRAAFARCQVREELFDTPMFECLRVIAHHDT